MHVAFLVPRIHERPTGGNIYNRRIITELRHRDTVEVVPWPPEVASQPSLDLPADAQIVVDSLLVRHEEGLRTLRTAYSEATFVLLAHYLHCIDPNEQDAPQAATERDVLSLFDGVVAPSRYGRRALTSEGVPASRIKVVPPGLDEAYRAPLSEQPVRDPPGLLTVANLLPGKGLRSLVEDLGALTEPAWTWTLVGDDGLDPDFAGSLHEKINASPIADRVTCPGPVPTEELRAHYDRADVFVLPSQFETCSMATREAMARGLPIVGYEVGGLPDNLSGAAPSGSAATPSDAAAPSDATTPSGAPAGRLVSSDQPDALTDVLRVLLTDPATRARMGQAGRERSRAFPTWEEAADRFHSGLQALRLSDRAH